VKRNNCRQPDPSVTGRDLPSSESRTVGDEQANDLSGLWTNQPAQTSKALLQSSGNREWWLTGSNSRWTVFGVCVFLAIAVWLVFGQTVRHEFVNFDDDVYVYENTAIKSGLTPAGVLLPFTHSHAGNWHPLTSVSHMLDCQIYGLNAGGHHLTNVLLHAATAILLFLVLRQMTGTLWSSAFVAAVFAIHPLRVESVAWVAERKDVLSGLFFMLTLAAYARYAQANPKPSAPSAPSALDSRLPGAAKRSEDGSTLDYFAVLLFFSLGLMSKPTLVTLPFVLLLLDYWPLQRFPGSGVHPSTVWRLIVEKIPLLVLSAAACVATLLAQNDVIQPTGAVSIPLRIGNAIISCAAYLGQMVYPAGLAVFYPYPADGLPLREIALALMVLVGISAGACCWRQKRPFFLVGWLWYLGMLMPVIGLVQAGTQARADRYTYLPQIGLYVALTWAAAESLAFWRHRRWILGGGAAIILAVLMAVACAQTRYWHDSESLWTHTLTCTSHNSLAEYNLGDALLHKGRMDEAITHCQLALEIRPGYSDAHNCLGFALLQKGQVDEAMSQFQEALKIQPALASAHNNLGMALLNAGRVDEAITHFRNALETEPGLAESHNNLGVALLRKGRVEEAVAHYQKALELQPDYAGANNNLAWVLATSPQASLRNGARAVELAQRANQLSSAGNLVILRTLAAAYAEAGRFPEAIATAGQALQLANDQSKTAWANALQSEIRLYQARQPFRDTSQTP
jgi:Flp pilus assembly protein TadD